MITIAVFNGASTGRAHRWLLAQPPSSLLSHPSLPASSTTMFAPSSTLCSSSFYLTTCTLNAPLECLIVLTSKQDRSEMANLDFKINETKSIKDFENPDWDSIWGLSPSLSSMSKRERDIDAFGVVIRQFGNEQRVYARDGHRPMFWMDTRDENTRMAIGSPSPMTHFIGKRHRHVILNTV